MNKINPSKGLTTAQISERVRQLKEERNALNELINDPCPGPLLHDRLDNKATGHMTPKQTQERIRQLKEERNAIHTRLSKSSISRRIEPQLHARLTVIAHDLETLSGRVGGGQ